MLAVRAAAQSLRDDDLDDLQGDTQQEVDGRWCPDAAGTGIPGDVRHGDGVARPGVRPATNLSMACQ